MMEIGEKIKRLRTAKLMTQAELAGSEITRNMLSRIENGAAQPSLGTVMYVAERLGVSPGFLLAGEEDDQLYFKSQEIKSIKRIYSDKNFRLCREMCQNSEWSDDELWLIMAECSLRIGTEEFCTGNLRSAAEYFDEAIEYCNKTVYNTDVIAAEAAVYFEYMEMISPTLSSNISEDGGMRTLIITGDKFCVYSGMFCEAEQSGFSAVSYLEYRMNMLGEDNAYALHIKARLMLENGEYSGAYELLHRLLFDNKFDIPQPMLYFIFCDMELCCKEKGDFKGAYEYSGSKMSLLQKLLS